MIMTNVSNEFFSQNSHNGERHQTLIGNDVSSTMLPSLLLLFLLDSAEVYVKSYYIFNN